MDKLVLVKGESHHIEEIAGKVRDADVLEYKRCSGKCVYETLTDSVELWEKSWAGYVGDEIVLLAGLSSETIDGKVYGVPWMVATDRLNTISSGFLKACKPAIEDMKKDVDFLVNFIDVENTVAMNWLEWLGFDIQEESQPHGVSQMPFKMFTMEGYGQNV